MEQLKEGQQIIFRHPSDGKVRIGVYEPYADIISYFVTYKGSAEVYVNDIPAVSVKEWCDAESTFKAWSLQQVRAGSFEWNEVPTVEPFYPGTEV